VIVISLALATICFAGECHNALVGKDTPIGSFQLIQRFTEQPGYGGDVLQFTETSDSWYAIHRVYTLNPKQHREQRLKSSKISDRLITNGCINVDPVIYERLKDCCSNEEVVIK
jgi:hypothetical protein